MEIDETLNEETASEQEEEVGSAGQDEQLADDQSQVDYKALYEQSEERSKNLESVLGRQGNELGDLRKLIEQNQKAGNLPSDIDPYQYFDEDTVKAIDKIVEEKAQRLYESKEKAAEEKSLRADFESVMNEYDITEENLSDLAFYAASKKVALRKAAEELSKKQILNKRTKPRTQNISGAAPTGAPRVATSSGGIVRDPLKMSPEEFKKLSDEEVERLGQKYYNRH